ncbi:hypothetical protein PQR37_32665 [Paraburkholderia nemoris]|uniref:hypothetical protein n=2 Tax=Paraburkholderia nemoris TaxID=2793076 RepID=UPI00190C7EA2|nr:hypothetical protein [Paraburkholderia nemoris]MBK3738067.1 hypothetical protein [Paraburkholderia aspalathi]MBK5146649.1 hypothetical protein [Burkholderia sp. R-69608]CAE6819215.1 hypothetical protein R69619_06038 [Paraburkholderia nemoris]CAE6859452.1 hypothetical protein R69608_00075 [Paraburkholderia nemoris]
MNMLDDTVDCGFHAALSAPARAADIDATDDLYGWLIGSWDMDVLHYRVDLGNARRRGEIHFGWVLEGRAVQDVWIMPPCREHHAGPTAADTMYGTTLRVWDPTLRAWRVTYMNPLTGQRDELIGRRVGNDLVQIGTHANGTPIRWNFTDITRDSFRWTGVALAQDGVTWTLEAEFHARRRR